VPNNLFKKYSKKIRLALIISLIIGVIFSFENYSIPTTSMEGTLRAGDWIMVNNWSYGLRTPITPVKIPFFSDRLAGFNIKLYSTLIQLSGSRVFDFFDVERNDVVVFNYPGDLPLPIDFRTRYIKRCVGLPGDTIQIVNRELLLNNTLIAKPYNLQHSYFIITKNRISIKAWTSIDVTEYEEMDNGTGYYAFLSDEQVEKIKHFPEVESIDPVINKPFENTEVSGEEAENYMFVFPRNKKFKWTMDFFGKLWIPKKGVTIPVTEENIILYGSTIINYDNPKNTRLFDGMLFVDNKPVTSYTFKQNYYWMMGDNRHNSADSRVFGFLPENHIIGQAKFIWISTNKSDKNARDYRWERFLMGIE